jgi:uncharacterized ion transporter superfamily protein YfcC
MTPQTIIGNGKIKSIKIIFSRKVKIPFTIVIMLIVALGKNGLGEKKVVDAFVNGASSLVGVQ